MAEGQPELRDRQPWKSAHDRDDTWLGEVFAAHYAGDVTSQVGNQCRSTSASLPVHQPGRRGAIVQLASRQDVANRFSIGGRLGAKIKAGSFTQLIAALAKEAHKPGSYSWHFKDHERREQVKAHRSGPLERPMAAPREGVPA